MAFDFDYADGAEIVNKTAPAEPMTYEKALENSLQLQVHAQIKNWDTGDILAKNGKPKPSNWFRQDTTGQWMISWRISNKPVYFTERSAKDDRKGWMPIRGDKVGDALKELADAVDSGKHDKALRDAYNRPARPKPKKKAEAEAETA